MLGIAIAGGALSGLIAKGITALQERYAKKPTSDPKNRMPSPKKKGGSHDFIRQISSPNTTATNLNPAIGENNSLTPKTDSASSETPATPLTLKHLLAQRGRLTDTINLIDYLLTKQVNKDKHEPLGEIRRNVVDSVEALNTYLYNVINTHNSESASKVSVSALSLNTPPDNNFSVSEIDIDIQLNEIVPEFKGMREIIQMIRKSVRELLETEKTFIHNYEIIINNRDLMLRAIRKYNELNDTNPKIDVEEYEDLLDKYYNKAVNHLQFNYYQEVRFAYDIFSLPDILKDIFFSTDFMNFHAHQLQPWVLHYPKINQPMVKIQALLNGKLNLTPEESTAVKFMTIHSGEAFQRLGRYDLFLTRFGQNYEAFNSPHLITEINQSLEYIQKQNQSIQRSIDVVNAPITAVKKLDDFINKINALLTAQPFYKKVNGIFTNPVDKIMMQCIQNLKERMEVRKIELKNILSNSKLGSMSDVRSPLFDKLLDFSISVRNDIEEIEKKYIAELNKLPNFTPLNAIPLYVSFKNTIEKFKSSYELFDSATLGELRTLEAAKYHPPSRPKR